MKFLYDKGKLFEQLYRDEAIPKRPGYPMPQQIKDVRALQRKALSMGDSRAEVFVKMARLMEEYEDDFIFNMKIRRDYPAYDCIDDVCLRGYFTWRTMYKKGEIQPAETYPEIYAYELLNGIGAADAAAAVEKLKLLADAFPSCRARINRLIYDHIIVNDLPKTMLPPAAGQLDDEIKMDILGAEPKKLMRAFISVSEMDNEMQHFFAGDICSEDEYAAIVYRCFAAISDYYETHRKKSLKEELFGKKQLWPYIMYSGAPVLALEREEGYTYNVSDVRQLKVHKGRWVLERYVTTDALESFAETLLKEINSLLRHKEKNPDGQTWRQNIIRTEVQRFEEYKSKIVNIDKNRLQSIREKAAEIRDRLIVDDEPGVMVYDESVNSGEYDASTEQDEHNIPASQEEQDSLLDNVERRVLECLLEGGRPDFLRDEGLILSVVTDSINEKLYDEIGDLVIDGGEEPFIIEDYLEDIKRLLGRDE
ncbi:MAG: TerB N-terminal domain-containing protein [Eubacterium sp.]|nr:TerB N-terminal domain-containing protein [Eubacterium sp.]